MTITGGCLCGSLRYEAKVKPQISIICCCRQCQQITGTGHAAQFGLPRVKVSITGEPKVHLLVADSGNTVSSAFCRDCGSPLFKATSGFPDMVFFHAATLDNPASFKPQSVVWTKSKQPWDQIDPTIPIRA